MARWPHGSQLTSNFSEATNKIIATWRMVAKAHKQYGKAVMDTFIASMSQQPSDVLTLLLLAREVGGRVMGAFIRATKPAHASLPLVGASAKAAKSCCGPECCH